MLGIIPVSVVLDMATPDDDTIDCYTVRDILDHKRSSPHYPELLEEIRRDGITTPIVIRDSPTGRYLADGHHRITAAQDAGITHVPWTDDWILADRIDRSKPVAMDAPQEPAMTAHPDDKPPTPDEVARIALADIAAVWANWTTGRLDTDTAMAAISDHLTLARELGALK